MIQVTINELSELRTSLVTLEEVLEKLDRIGAGIAAIHVDAAINQLKNNLEVIAHEPFADHREAGGCQSECPPYLP